MSDHDRYHKAAEIVADAGGKLVGRTRLQKVAYLAQLAGFDDFFRFEYRHYGPFSEELADAVEVASGLGLLNEEEKRTQWGGWYSVYTAPGTPSVTDAGKARFVAKAAEIGAVELELAATAAFLYAHEGIGASNGGDPWAETAKRKPEKAEGGRLQGAKDAYRELLKIETPVPLPRIL